MSYEKHNWQCGETITADKMNHIEDGIEEALDCCSTGGSLFVRYDRTYEKENSWELLFDKEMGEIFDAIDNGIPVFVQPIQFVNPSTGVPQMRRGLVMPVVMVEDRGQGEWRVICDDSDLDIENSVLDADGEGHTQPYITVAKGDPK